MCCKGWHKSQNSFSLNHEPTPEKFVCRGVSVCRDWLHWWAYFHLKWWASIWFTLVWLVKLSLYAKNRKTALSCSQVEPTHSFQSIGLKIRDWKTWQYGANWEWVCPSHPHPYLFFFPILVFIPVIQIGDSPFIIDKEILVQ